MKIFISIICACGILESISSGCKQPYLPPIAKANLGFLVVDGIIISGQDSTIINLSRTQNITDSNFIPQPEMNANVSIIGQYNESYQFAQQSSGKYVAGPLNLNSNETYQLRIITTDNKEYRSDSVNLKTTPAIDSVFWRQDSIGVNIYLTTHDPTSNTRYYRWDYTETWEYHSAFESLIEIDSSGQVITRKPEDKFYYCWRTVASSEVKIASSVNLTQDIIYETPLTLIPHGSQKLGIEYSILVKQYALTADAFAYWQNLKLNTEQLGTIFAPQPSQLAGNIHCITNPNEPVLGYVSACTIQQQRIFIKNNFPDWNYDAGAGCVLDTPRFAGDYVGNIPVNVFTVMRNKVLLVAVPDCVDCRRLGGVTTKPSFWPN